MASPPVGGRSRTPLSAGNEETACYWPPDRHLTPPARVHLPGHDRPRVDLEMVARPVQKFALRKTRGGCCPCDPHRLLAQAQKACTRSRFCITLRVPRFTGHAAGRYLSSSTSALPMSAAITITTSSRAGKSRSGRRSSRLAAAGCATGAAGLRDCAAVAVSEAASVVAR